MNNPAPNKPALSKKESVISKTSAQLKNLLIQRIEALPSDFNSTRFQQSAIEVIRNTRGIESIDPVTIAKTLMEGACLGLIFGSECYAICYGTTMNFQTDYKGEMKLALKYGRNVKSIYAKLVREGDDLNPETVNGQQTISFKERPFNDGKIIGAFSVCLFEDDSMIYELMSSKEIEGVRMNYSKASNSKAWKDSPGEMYKKTVLRRLCKVITLDFSNQEQADAWDAGSGVDFNKPSAPTPQVAKSSLDAEIQGDVIDSKAEVMPQEKPRGTV